MELGDPKMVKLYKATKQGNVEMTAAEAKLVTDTQANYKTPEYLETKLEVKRKLLKEAASNYEANGFSNIGNSILTIGVIQSKPKALAVAAWAEALWTEYFRRAALISLDTMPDLDFSSIGLVPYDILQLKEELDLTLPKK